MNLNNLLSFHIAWGSTGRTRVLGVFLRLAAQLLQISSDL